MKTLLTAILLVFTTTVASGDGVEHIQVFQPVMMGKNNTVLWMVE